MSRWFRVMVPLGIAAVLLAVLAVGFGSAGSLAAPGGNGGGDVTSADGCNGSLSTKGSIEAGGSAEYQATFCSDPGANFYVWLSWGRYSPDKDLALHVTGPNGLEFHVDHDNSSAETLTVYGPLPEGPWSIEVTNEGSRTVRYDLTFGFR
jgi:hypothetical protein